MHSLGQGEVVLQNSSFGSVVVFWSGLHLYAHCLYTNSKVLRPFVIKWILLIVEEWSLMKNKKDTYEASKYLFINYLLVTKGKFRQ